MKLKWARDSGGSEKRQQDVLRIYELQGDTLDRTYLESWGDRLGVRELWERVVAPGCFERHAMFRLPLGWFFDWVYHCWTF